MTSSSASSLYACAVSFKGIPSLGSSDFKNYRRQRFTKNNLKWQWQGASSSHRPSPSLQPASHLNELRLKNEINCLAELSWDTGIDELVKIVVPMQGQASLCLLLCEVGHPNVLAPCASTGIKRQRHRRGRGWHNHLGQKDRHHIHVWSISIHHLSRRHELLLVSCQRPSPSPWKRLGQLLAKVNCKDASQSFGGCARDVQKEDRILREVVRKVLELLAHTAHDLFERAHIIHIQLRIHHLLPLGAFDGDFHYVSNRRKACSSATDFPDRWRPPMMVPCSFQLLMRSLMVSITGLLITSFSVFEGSKGFVTSATAVWILPLAEERHAHTACIVATERLEADSMICQIFTSQALDWVKHRCGPFFHLKGKIEEPENI